jgi:hypothetical protein
VVSLPDNYLLNVVDGRPPLAMREYPDAALQGFFPEIHSPDGARIERRFLRYCGFGVRNRVAASVTYVGVATRRTHSRRGTRLRRRSSMGPAIRAAREQVAQERLLAAAETLAGRFGLQAQHEALAAARTGIRDPLVAGLFQREAIADLAGGAAGRNRANRRGAGARRAPC